MDRALLPLLFVALMACGGEDSGPRGRLTVLVDGVRFTATVNTVAQNAGEYVGISGVADDRRTVALGFRAALGAQAIGEAGQNIALSDPATGEVWQAVGAVGSGEIEVTTLTATEVAGTFEAELPAAVTGPATGTRVLTAGEFSIPF